jgi:hypothetical protein
MPGGEQWSIKTDHIGFNRNTIRVDRKTCRASPVHIQITVLCHRRAAWLHLSSRQESIVRDISCTGTLLKYAD